MFRNSCCRWAGLLALVLCLRASPAQAIEVKLAHHPDHNNGKIVFSYLGDLWVVNEDGSNPQRLTVHPARDVFPRFSPDGKMIAFSSDRYGNYDVFVMPAEGGKAKQLTYHSGNDMVVGWSRDGRKVIFQSSRGMMFPGIPNLYEVPLDGGLEQPVPTDWGSWGSYSPDGKKFAYNRHPMPWSRKHYRGSYCADLWVLDLNTQKHRRIVDDTLPDDEKASNYWPMYGSGGDIYFVSDRATKAKSGSPEVMKSVNNVWRVNDSTGALTQVTFHTSGNLYWPSMSADSKVIVYEEDFGLWKFDCGTGKTSQIKVNITSDDKENNLRIQSFDSECDSFSLSPSTKRAVISVHGELFTIATDKGETRRVTQTPNLREVQPAWSPDGKRIAFIGEKDGLEQVFVCDEKGGQMKMLSSGDTQKGQLRWAPDSSALLFTGSDNKLYKHSFDSGKTTVIMGAEIVTGEAAIANPQWSPDSKWISFNKSDRNLLPHVYVMPAAGGEAKRITDDHVYSDSSALWTPDGKYLVYLQGVDAGSIGAAPNKSTVQLYALPLQPETRDRTDKAIDSEEDAVKRTTGGGQGGFKAGDKVEVQIDWNKIGRRSRQLTKVADNVGTLAVSPDGKIVVFNTGGTEGGRRVNSIWSISIDGGNPARVTQEAPPEPEEGAPPQFGGFGGGFSAMQFSKDGKTLYYKQGKSIYAAAVATPTAGPDMPMTDGGGKGGKGGKGGGGVTPAAGTGATARKIPFTAKVEIDDRAERRQVFLEAWRVMKHRFYDAKMHGSDWDKVRQTYEPLLEHVADQEELHNIISMMLGELNASHTGISGGARRGGGKSGVADNATRHPGFDMEADKSGYYKVTHVYRDGPCEKGAVKISEGDFILAFNELPLKAGDNYWKLFTLAPTSKFEFTVNSKPALEGAWTAKVTPIGIQQLGNLQYTRWVDARRAAVDRISGGSIGYLHIRQMNADSLKQFERDLAMLANKKALIIDQRFNPGGNIDQELMAILQQKQYQKTQQRGSMEITRPLRGFFGPMVVMANERSTSDAEVFPDGFKTLKLGKVVGMTTYGAVIGTGAYQLMDGSSIRTPGFGLWNAMTGTNLENHGVVPDVYVDNTPEDFFRGRDAQLEKAIEVLRQDLAQRK
jgi:tricorn protease